MWGFNDCRFIHGFLAFKVWMWDDVGFRADTFWILRSGAVKILVPFGVHLLVLLLMSAPICLVYARRDHVDPQIAP